ADGTVAIAVSARCAAVLRPNIKTHPADSEVRCCRGRFISIWPTIAEQLREHWRRPWQLSVRNKHYYHDQGHRADSGEPGNRRALMLRAVHLTQTPCNHFAQFN